MPFFSLVVSTKGRTHELATLLASLQAQTCRDFEVLVVDQNDGSELLALLGRDWGFPLVRLPRPRERGLSRGRNVGWRAASGTFVCFPDDDCWYDPGFLTYAARRLNLTQADVLTGRAAAPDGRSINGRFEEEAQRVSRRERVWTTQIEWVAFFRRTLLERLKGYDDEVGVGASSPWQACEGQEIVLRALESGAACFYDPDLVGRHAEMVVDQPDRSTIRKARAYGRGMDHVLRKHRFGVVAGTYWTIRPLLRAVLLLVRMRPADARYYAAVALGRFEGAVGRLLFTSA